MARNTTRVGRRRRVLNEEVLSATNIAIHKGTSQRDIEPGDTPRYGAGANIENHPQVTSFVPRRFRMFCAFAILGIGVAIAAEAIAHFAEPLSQFTAVVSPAELTETFANRPVAWTSAALLLLTLGYTRLIYSLRRHRVDDDKGRYRVWRTAGWAATLLSINAVLSAHELIARYLGHVVEYQMLPASAGWWLIPSALLGGWLLIKLMIDASECRGALSLYVLAVICLVVAGVSSAGWSPSWAAAWPDTMSRSLPLVAYTLLLVGSQLFARYVILDVQGLIAHAAPATTEVAIAQETQPQAELKPSRKQAKKKGAEEGQDDASAWVDGSEPEIDYDGEPTRRLSKAERKRLRKQKQRNRAA